MPQDEETESTQIYFSALHIQLSGSPPKPVTKTVTKTESTDFEFKKPADRRSLDLPVKSVDTTISQQVDESVWENPLSSTHRESIEPGELPNYSMISMVGDNDYRRANRDITSVYRPVSRQRKSPAEIQHHDEYVYTGRDWYHDLQLRLDNLLWKYQTLDQEYAFLQKVAGEQCEGVKKLVDGGVLEAN